MLREVVSLQKSVLAELGILAVVIGGSTVYNSAQHVTQNLTRDIDGAILVSSAEDIQNIIDHHRSRLRLMLRISLEECSETVLLSSKSSAWSDIDAVRYSGFAGDGRKISFKLISLEHFRGSRRCMNILSLKDRRVYEGLTFDGTPAYRLQQATRLDSKWAVLHDPWLYEGQSNTLAFGVTADLLLTGCWLRDDCTVGVRIRHELMAHATGRLGSRIGRICFAKSDKFDPTFQTWLQTQYQAEDGLPQIETRSTIDPASHMHLVLFGPAASPGFAASVRRKGNRRQVPSDISFRRTEDGSLALEEIYRIKIIFSSNSACRMVRVSLKDREGARKTLTLFSKSCISEFQSLEMVKSLDAAEYFPLVQIPLYEDGQLLYPVFDGRTEAEAQLEYRRTGSVGVFESILDVEMRKSEDIFNAYQKSLQPATASSHHPGTWSIHRFFHERLHNYRRLRQFYGSGIHVSGLLIDFDHLIKLPIDVDGIDMPCLSVLHEQADADLHPSNLISHPVVYGLGDAHGGNIMIEAGSRLSGHPLILYVDYEASGLHSALLDIAKPFYNDIFFDTLYADHLDERTKVGISVQNGKLRLQTSVAKQQLPSYILEIKRRFLIEPLLSLASQKGIDISSGMPALRSALFACALCTRNFSENPRAFALSLYHAVMLSQARTIEDLFEVCAVLLGNRI